MAPGSGSRPAATRTAGGPSTTAPTAGQAPGATWPPAATGSKTAGSGSGTDDRVLLAGGSGQWLVPQSAADNLAGAQRAGFAYRRLVRSYVTCGPESAADLEKH